MDSKVTQILEACRDRDLDAIVGFATSEQGLVNDHVRRTACKVQS